MSLSTGTRLGPYEILGLLGAGGMGQVYKARDTRLDRTVAVKSLNGPHTERFEREAQAIAALNHPHICTLYDVGPDYLVMEYLEGRPLKGPLPLDEALRLASQMADALNAAHRKGIIHRDLKPGNILLTKSGIKLLDFGLAKLSSPSIGDGQATYTVALTEKGAVLGTYPYMAPEQLEGKEADARSDIFAFGAVLYEVLTGKRAFSGETAASVIGAILHKEPAAAPQVTGPVEPLLRRCLAKDPDDRWQTAADLKWELERLLEDKAAPVTARPSWLWWIGALAGLVIVAVLGGVGMWLRQPATDVRSFRFSVTPPPGAEFRFGVSGGSAISPDGRLVAFVAAARGKASLWIRPLDSLAGRELPGTEGASCPFWSPDSRSLAFFAAGKLKRIDAEGRTLQVLCDAAFGLGGTWNSEGVILFAANSIGALERVSASGGTPSFVTKLDSRAHEIAHRWPRFLPDSRRFLYYVRSGQSEHRGIYAGSLDDPVKKVHLVNTDYVAFYAPAQDGRSGYLLWFRQQTLMAQRFNIRTLRLEGEATLVTQGVGQNSVYSAADFSVSDTGLLLYGMGGDKRQMVWMSREGNALSLVGPPDAYLAPRLSTDGKKLVLARGDSSGNWNLWQVELSRGLLTRFTFEPGRDLQSTWSYDGRQIVFSSTRNGTYNLYRKESSGTGPEERLTNSDKPQYVNDWSRDGRFVLYSESSEQTGLDVYLLPITGDRKPIRFLQTPFNESNGQFSRYLEGQPRWIAYASDESGRYEVYVRAFPNSGAKWLVSSQGGRLPRWRSDGKELFYLSAEEKLMSLAIKERAGAPEWDTPRPLFPVVPTGSLYPYDVAPDGQHFLVLQPAEEDKSQAMTVIINWQAGLPK